MEEGHGRREASDVVSAIIEFCHRLIDLHEGSFFPSSCRTRSRHCSRRMSRAAWYDRSNASYSSMYMSTTMPMPTICTYARWCLSRRRRVYLWSAAPVETRPPALSPPCRCIVPTRSPTVMLSWTGEDGGASSSSASSTIGPRRASPSVGLLAGEGLFSNCICLMDGGGLV